MTTSIAVQDKKVGASLVKLRKLRGENRYRYFLTPVGDAANAYRQSFRITKVSNPKLLQTLGQHILSGKATSFTVRMDKRSFPVVAQRLTANTIRYEWAGETTFVFSEDDDDDVIVSASGAAIVAIVCIVGIVAIVGLNIIYDDEESGVEGEADGREEGGSEEGGGEEGGGEEGGGEEEG